MFDTFDKKVINLFKDGDFKNDIFENEVVWTYSIALLALNNSKIYEKLTGLKYIDTHNIFLEAQPKTIYSGLEGNSVIDLVAGAVAIREGTVSGIELLNHEKREVCFLEAKYNSDLSVKTSYCVIRNQMDRVLENLLTFQGNNIETTKVVFSLLTPRIYKDVYGSRIYSYKFDEYSKLLNFKNDVLAKKIELPANFQPNRIENHSYEIEKSLNKLTMNWITFEDLIEIEFDDVLENELNDGKPLDITNYSQAEKIWNRIRTKILKECQI